MCSIRAHDISTSRIRGAAIPARCSSSTNKFRPLHRAASGQSEIDYAHANSRVDSGRGSRGSLAAVRAAKAPIDSRSLQAANLGAFLVSGPAAAASTSCPVRLALGDGRVGRDSPSLRSDDGNGGGGRQGTREHPGSEVGRCAGRDGGLAKSPLVGSSSDLGAG